MIGGSSWFRRPYTASQMYSRCLSDDEDPSRCLVCPWLPPCLQLLCGCGVAVVYPAAEDPDSTSPTPTPPTPSSVPLSPPPETRFLHSITRPSVAAMPVPASLHDEVSSPRHMGVVANGSPHDSYAASSSRTASVTEVVKKEGQEHEGTIGVPKREQRRLSTSFLFAAGALISEDNSLMTR